MIFLPVAIAFVGNPSEIYKGGNELVLVLELLVLLLLLLEENGPPVNEFPKLELNKPEEVDPEVAVALVLAPAAATTVDLLGAANGK